MKKIDVYNKLPVFAQNLACNFEGKKIKKNRYNRKFWEYLNQYENRCSWSHEQIIEYRNDKLRKIIKHCNDTVPYYNNLFKELDIDYKEIKTIEDLNVLPIITKKTVNENFNDFLSTQVSKKNLVVSHTSGTTGSGFKFYTTYEAVNEQWAVWWRYRRNLGIEFNMWCALFGGQSIVPIDQKKPPFFRLNSPNKQVYFSGYHMSERNLHWYIKELERRKLKWIHGYPSSISLLADYILINNIKLSYQVDFITIGAENLLPSQILKIKKAFNVTPYQHYGLAEGVANFSQNLTGEMFVDDDFSAVEFVTQGKNLNFDVIGTTLSNYAMPLLRYKTGDIANVENTLKGTIIKTIDGRSEDYVILPDGTKVGRLDHIFKNMVNVIEAQIVQKKKSEVIIKVVKNKYYNQKDEEILYSETKQRLKDANIIIQYVDRIPRSNTGKLRFVVSEID